MLNAETRRELERISDDIERKRGVLMNAIRTGRIEANQAGELVMLLDQLMYYVEKELQEDSEVNKKGDAGELEPVIPVEDKPCSVENTPSPFGVPVPNLPGSKNFSKPIAPKGGKTKT